jgi:tRNA G10  N-methylase Trm11
MYKSLCILGRQIGIALAELESLFGAQNVMPFGQHAALLDIDPQDIPFERLGSIIKIAKIITELPSGDWKAIVNHVTTNAPKHLAGFPEGKIKFGLSVYGGTVKPSVVNATALTIKKETKALRRSIRVIPNNESTLSSAQVLHNKLTKPMGVEMIVVINGNKTVLALTKHVQNIDAYTARDQQRPMRDARVGMLPPKLAQTIINLASPKPDTDLLDPFCGTGVVLQEALLMGLNAYGTDLEQRMVEYSKKNLDWLEDAAGFTLSSTYLLEVGDATNFEWQHFDSVACETYLGRPFSTEPNPDKLKDVIQDVDTIHKKFLQNVARQTKPGFRMCIAVPAWHTSRGIKHLPILDHLTDMGYTHMSFVHAKHSELIYHREGQIVGRELVVLIRK